MSARAITATIAHKIKQDFEAEMFRDYIARCARLLTENTAKICSGSYIRKEYTDLIELKPQDNRSAEEIIADVTEKAGIEVIE